MQVEQCTSAMNAKQNSNEETSTLTTQSISCVQIENFEDRTFCKEVGDV
jgi:hypothetical protein